MAAWQRPQGSAVQERQCGSGGCRLMGSGSASWCGKAGPAQAEIVASLLGSRPSRSRTGGDRGSEALASAGPAQAVIVASLWGTRPGRSRTGGDRGHLVFLGLSPMPVPRKR